jgi:hypothetical protein
MKRHVTIFLLCLLVSGFFYCTKEGPRGRTGNDGKDGKDGNANVMTYLITDPVKLTWDMSNKIFLYYDTTFTIPDSIRNEGVVLVYMRYKTAPSYWYPAPGLAVDAFWMTRVSIGSNVLIISLYDPDGTSWSGTTDISVSDLRVILISPSSLQILARKGISTGDHDAVCAELGIM